MTRVRYILSTLVILVAGAAHAATLHVPADYATIKDAAEAARDGDTVLVADGVYGGPGWRHLGTNGRDVIIRSANGPANCIIDNGGEAHAFHFRNGEGPGAVVRGFTIRNSHYPAGGGILCDGTSPTVMDNIVINTTADDGGGIGCINGSAARLINNIVIGCSASSTGGGIAVIDSPEVRISNATITGCHAGMGGGLACTSSAISVTGSILWGNTAYSDNEIHITGTGAPAIWYSDIQGGWSGQGNIDTDPLFTAGPLGDHYLSQASAGQPADSPCLDAGNRGADLAGGATRSDSIQDRHPVDMGFHYPLNSSEFRIVTGPGPAETNPPTVRLSTPAHHGTWDREFNAYGAHQFGVNITVGQLDSDPASEIITGAGPGSIYGPHVRGFDGSGTPLSGLNFLAYGTPRWGVNVAAGDIDGDGFDELITGAGPGAVFGPHVRAFNYDGSGTVSTVPGASWFSYGTLKFGVNVATGDIDGDGFDEVVTGAGPGAVFGPHVRGWNLDGGAVAPIPGLSYFAYGTLKFGVNVACGDMDGDGVDEIITTPGPSAVFGAHVRGWNHDGSGGAPMPGLSFFAWPTTEVRYGARSWARSDLDGDGRTELLVGAGPDPAAGNLVKAFSYDGTVVEEWFGLETSDGNWTHGTSVAAGRF